MKGKIMAALPFEMVIELEPESKELLERLVRILEELRKQMPDGDVFAKALSNATKFKEAE